MTNSISSINKQNGITLAFSTEARSNMWNTFSHRKRIISYLTPQDASSFHAIHQAFNRKQSKWPDKEEGQSTRVIVTKDPEKGVEHLRLKAAKEVWNLEDLSLHIFSFLNVKEACRIFQVCRIFSPIRSMYFCRGVKKIDLHTEQDRALYPYLPGIIFKGVTTFIEHSRFQQPISNLIKSFPNLTTVDLAGRNFEEVQTLISNCSGLTRLSLTECRLYADSKGLRLSKKIIHFSVNDCRLTGQDFFVRNAHLQTLFLQKTDFLSACYNLEKLVKLSQLTLHEGTVRKGTLQKVAQLPSLIHLTIFPHYNIDFSELKNSSKLQFITILGPFNKEALMGLTQISTLKGIELKYGGVDDDEYLADLQNKATQVCEKAGIRFTLTAISDSRGFYNL